MSKLYPTSKIRAIRKFHSQSALGNDAADSMLNEVHFLPNGALSYNVIMWLEHLKAQLGQHGCYKVWLCIGKQGHGCHQLATIEVYNFLRKDSLLEVSVKLTTEVLQSSHSFSMYEWFTDISKSIY